MIKLRNIAAAGMLAGLGSLTGVPQDNFARAAIQVPSFELVNPRQKINPQQKNRKKPLKNTKLHRSHRRTRYYGGSGGIPKVIRMMRSGPNGGGHYKTWASR